MTDVLTPREINRATLDRQFLLRRTDAAVTDVLTRVVGMQAQAPNPPYFGLWARVAGFQQDDLIKLVTLKKTSAALELSPFGKVSKHDTAALEAEGAELLAFAAPQAQTADVRVTSGG